MLETMWLGKARKTLTPKQGDKALNKSKRVADEMQKKITDTWGKARRGYANGTVSDTSGIGWYKKQEKERLSNIRMDKFRLMGLDTSEPIDTSGIGAVNKKLGLDGGKARKVTGLSRKKKG
jgi:hypothetical protein